MITLSETDFLKLSLAVERVARKVAEAQVVQSAQDALLMKLCADYAVDPKTHSLDLSTGTFTPKETPDA